MKKILVIEDERDVRDVILDILDAEEFDALGAENGLVGVQLAQEKAPDLIICDVMMPELDGLGVLAALRKHPETAAIPFVFLTAKASKDDFRQGMELGADDYLTKPFTRSQLLKTISTRLEKQAVVDERVQQKLDDVRSTITLALPHELITPLNAIAGLSSVLMNECSLMEQAEIVEVAEDIHNSTQTLHRLVQNFLLYAQLELLVKSPERIKALRKGITHSVSMLVSDWVTQKAQEMNRATDLQLELKDAVVQVPQAKLKKIVDELVDNACKFSPSGTPIRILSRCNEHTFILYVIDQGRGMTPEQIENVGAYVQFERKLYEQQGSGLGLAIAKRLAELQGGELGIESIPGKQTTVRVVLPLAQD
ncbi:response regulator [Trichocoleus sp. FACHB-262]|uniref:hybrid sensor histidine kinase/response regulator n=1 Tax=Trichocoleus sp. FACHB-262 TaxID=2692869 RepID=UPI001683F246|nr:response regulator [Trichocoleus sp. FACHB-262]MBD2122242.1 response regulator [Trichocoleus sp. FACHB-262]